MQNRVAPSVESMQSCAFKAPEEMPIDDFGAFFPPSWRSIPAIGVT
jgi:hypothetical protein